MRHINYILLAVLFLVPSIALAAPSQPSFTGDFPGHNGTVTLSGSGFGVKSPVAPQFWDPVDGMYSSTTNHTAVPIGEDEVWKSCVFGVCPQFKTTNPRGKWTAKYTTEWSGRKGTVGGRDFSGADATGVIYVTWWMWASKDDCYYNEAIDGYGGNSDKFLRLTNDGHWDNDKSIYIWAPSLSQYYDYPQSFVYGGWDAQQVDDADTCPPVAQWTRMETLVDNNTTPLAPSEWAWMNNSSVGSTPMVPRVRDMTHAITGIYALGFDTSNRAESTYPIVDFGEIYVDNTRARVEICNASVKANADHCEVQIPQNTWVNDEIEIKVNQGSFPDGSSAYLYVIDANGDSSPAKPIQFGAQLADEDRPTIAYTTPANGAVGVDLNTSVFVGFSENMDSSYKALTISPDTAGTVTVSGSTMTMPNSGQSNATEYTVTVPTTVRDTSGNQLASQYQFSYTTVAASGDCSTDNELCESESECSSNWPAYNWCPESPTPCQESACAECSVTNWMYCTTQEQVDAANAVATDDATIYFWEGYTRTEPEPMWSGSNLILNPDVSAPWSGSTPTGWGTYYTATENALGASLSNGQELYYPNVLVAGKTYYYAFNIMPGMVGQLKLYKWNDDIYFDSSGTKIGTITLPSSGVTDHGLYFDGLVGSNSAIFNHVVIKELSTYRSVNVKATGTTLLSKDTGTPVNIVQ